MLAGDFQSSLGLDLDFRIRCCTWSLQHSIQIVCSPLAKTGKQKLVSRFPSLF